jgi:hypothetical protein
MTEPKQKAIELVEKCWAHPPIFAYKILVDQSGNELSRESIGADYDGICPYCHKKWALH